MIAFALLVLTLAGVMARPRGVAEWIVAAAGAAAMVLIGVLSPTAALSAIVAQWNVLLFFLGLMLTAVVAEQSGVLSWLTAGAFRVARGRQDVLFLLVCSLCVGVTATLSNDATILLLTPLVLRLASTVRAPVLPYAFACVYLANASSSLLPIANPANVIVLQARPMNLTVYLDALLAPSVAAIVATVAAIAVMHRTALRSPLTIDGSERAGDSRDTRAFAVALGAVLSAYLVALELAVPIGPVSVVGGSLLLTALVVSRSFDMRVVRDEIEWGVFPLFAALVVIVAGAERAGLLDLASAALRELGAHSLGPALIGLATTLAANAMNNLPAAVMAGGALAHTGLDQPSVVAAVLVGIDIGPNFTTFGSIATLLWLMQIRKRGISLSSLDYLRASLVPSAAALAAALLALLASR